MTINQKFLDALSVAAKENPRLRQHFDLRTSPADGSQRMLNALALGTVVPVHRHLDTSETVLVLRGSVRELFFDEDGNQTEAITLQADGENVGVQIPPGQWHTIEPLEPGTVIFEAKHGAFEPLKPEDIQSDT
jgi:cupin fold WbuC family metalloprotein